MKMSWRDLLCLDFAWLDKGYKLLELRKRVPTFHQADKILRSCLRICVSVIHLSRHEPTRFFKDLPVGTPSNIAVLPPWSPPTNVVMEITINTPALLFPATSLLMIGTRRGFFIWRT